MFEPVKADQLQSTFAEADLIITTELVIIFILTSALKFRNIGFAGGKTVEIILPAKPEKFERRVDVQ